MPSEKNIQRSIIRWLNSQEIVWHVKTTQGGYGRAGIPDIIACVAGEFLAIEVKAPGGRPSKLQAHEILKIAKAGGMVVVTDNLDEVKQAVDMLRRRSSFTHSKES